MGKMTKTKKRCLGGGGNSSATPSGMPPAPSASSYSSGETYGTVVNGTVNSQMSRVFGDSPTFGSNSPLGQSNAIIGSQGQLSAGHVNSTGGKRRKRAGKKSRKTRGKGKRGGVFGSVLNQAIVPFGILALQQSFGRKKTNGTEKYYKNKSSRRRG